MVNKKTMLYAVALLLLGVQFKDVQASATITNNLTPEFFKKTNNLTPGSLKEQAKFDWERDFPAEGSPIFVLISENEISGKGYPQGYLIKPGETLKINSFYNFIEWIGRYKENKSAKSSLNSPMEYDGIVLTREHQKNAAAGKNLQVIPNASYEVIRQPGMVYEILQIKEEKKTAAPSGPAIK